MQGLYTAIDAQSFSNYFEGVFRVIRKCGGPLFFVLCCIYLTIFSKSFDAIYEVTPLPLCAFMFTVSLQKKLSKLAT